MGLADLFNKYQYNASPEGTNPVEKILGLGKYGLAFGLFVGVFKLNVLRNAPPITRLAGAASTVVPYVVGSCTFALATYAAVNIRKKDDYYNYTIGAIATMPLYYGWFNTLVAPTFFSAFTWLFGMILKNRLNANVTTFLSAPHIIREQVVWYEDLTYTKDPRKEGYTVFK